MQTYVYVFLSNNCTDHLFFTLFKDDVDPELEEPRKLDRAQRENLYNKGCTMQEEGKSDKALKYFLASITGLSENNSYHDLPHCLHQVSFNAFDTAGECRRQVTNLTNFVKKRVNIVEFDHIWNHHEKCIQFSNKYKHTWYWFSTCIL